MAYYNPDIAGRFDDPETAQPDVFFIDQWISLFSPTTNLAKTLEKSNEKHDLLEPQNVPVWNKEIQLQTNNLAVPAL